MKRLKGIAFALMSALCFAVWLPRVEAQTLFQFAKEPAGEDEVAIAKFMGECFKALNKHDLKPWLACFADDAKIDSRASGSGPRSSRVVDKGSYETDIARAFRFGSPLSVVVKEAEINLQSPTQATIIGIQDLASKYAGRSVDKFFWKLEKRAGGWLIVETKYQ